MTVPAGMESESSDRELMQETLGAIFVQLTRIYDVLMLLLPEEKMDKLEALHSAGGVLSSAPQLVEGAFDEDTIS